MTTISLKNNELQYLLDSILEKNISTRLEYGIAETILEKLTKEIEDKTLVKTYSDNFYDINKKWKID